MIFERKKYGSSGKWSDKFSIEQKKTAEHFVYLNNHKQIYNNEQDSGVWRLIPWGRDTLRCWLS